MSYYTELLLLARVRKDNRAEVRKELKNPPNYEEPELRYFLSILNIRDTGTLNFKCDEETDTEYCEDDEGTVDAVKGKWYGIDPIVQWLAQRVDRNSRMIFHSLEADGGSFGYEFDGRGKMRYLELKPTTGWALCSPPLIARPARKKVSKKTAARSRKINS